MTLRARGPLAAGACGVLLLLAPRLAPLVAQPSPAPLTGERVVRQADSLWRAAVGRQTRAVSGAPGPKYWVQSARYDLRVTLDPDARTLRGEGTLRYRNRSPDTLGVLAISLAQNLFRSGAPHNESVPISGGITIESFCVLRRDPIDIARQCNRDAGRGSTTRELRIDNTIAWLTLSAPLPPGDSLDIGAGWTFTIPTDDAPRMGTDGSVTMLGYWYPQFCVYDDVVGWQVDPYLATGEFYMDDADYDVKISVPAGFLVAATGVLQNAEDVLTPSARARLQRAAGSAVAIPIVNDSLRKLKAGTAEGPTLTWHFTATQVRDFAFYTSQEVVWDAMAALVPGSASSTDTVLIHAFYRPRERDWRRAADFGRQSIEQFSRLLWPYPWPQMTLVEGVVDGGMEYPMLAVVSVRGDSRELLTTVAHEIGHMWYPMQVGSDERRFAWMDEGLASWLERSLLRYSTGHDDDVDGIPALYRSVARLHGEQSMMTHADHYSGALTFTAASYDKLVVVLRAFSAEYGDTALVAGLRAYGAAWSGRHPYPADFVQMVFAAAGDERNAFARDWIYGTGTFDAQIDDVQRARDTLTVTVQSTGGAQLSVPVVITRDDGRIERVRISAAAFRRNTTQTIHIAGARSVISIVLDPARALPDMNTGNQRWAP